MCSFCGHFRCPGSCPNAPPPDPALYCGACEEGLFQGDIYYDTPEGIKCENCFDDYMEQAAKCMKRVARRESEDWW